MPFKVSTFFEGLTVPLSLTTYKHLDGDKIIEPQHTPQKRDPLDKRSPMWYCHGALSSQAYEPEPR